MSRIRRTRDLGRLHNVLLRACPPNDKGVSSIPTLARALNVSPQTVYERWIKHNYIPQRRVDQILLLADGRVTMDELIPFVMNAPRQ